jgi:Zn-dependent M28 family amino/carboxypeptidase
VPFTFTGGGGERHGVNVLGQLSGTAAFPKYIIVSAHYDHIGTKNGQVFNGADDNASGTAALFAIAKHFSEHKPAHPIIFAAFDGEEVEWQGSRVRGQTARGCVADPQSS